MAIAVVLPLSLTAEQDFPGAFLQTHGLLNTLQVFCLDASTLQVKLLVEPALPIEHHVANCLGAVFLSAEHKLQQQYHSSSKSTGGGGSCLSSKEWLDDSASLLFSDGTLSTAGQISSRPSLDAQQASLVWAWRAVMRWSARSIVCLECVKCRRQDAGCA